ncbi:hypothetical protein [Nonomuraea sp. LPB2021202275-12-8]|uniref:hypothetical protein n=1 Tax=Nonomuraea sp. LPB2021202275-12-8 TaxID=3120159 RepID=UPI00300DA045
MIVVPDHVVAVVFRLLVLYGGKRMIHMAEGSGSGEHFSVSIGLHENFVVARAVGELDYASAGLLRRPPVQGHRRPAEPPSCASGVRMKSVR